MHCYVMICFLTVIVHCENLVLKTACAVGYKKVFFEPPSFHVRKDNIKWTCSTSTRRVSRHCVKCGEEVSEEILIK